MDMLFRLFPDVPFAVVSLIIAFAITGLYWLVLRMFSVRNFSFSFKFRDATPEARQLALLSGAYVALVAVALWVVALVSVLAHFPGASPTYGIIVLTATGVYSLIRGLRSKPRQKTPFGEQNQIAVTTDAEHREMIVQLMKGDRRMDWTLWPAVIYNSQLLTPKGKDAVLWARDVLQRTLGDNFIQEIEKRSIQHPIFSLDLWPANDVPKVYANLFQLAAQIELLQSTVGWARVRNELRTDLRRDRWISTLLQLEVASLGLREGWQIELERPLPNGGTTDVTLTKTSAKLVVETKAMLLSSDEQEASEYFYQMSQALMALAWKYNVRITGSIGPPLSPDAQIQWLNKIEKVAEKTARNGKPQTILGPVSGQLEITKETGMPWVIPLEGFLIETDVGKRLVDKLFKTNKQYENAGPACVRLGDYAGLWQSSSLQGKTLSEKLEILAPFLQQVLAILPNLSGVIISPDVWPTASPLSNSKIRPGTQDGSIAVSCPIPGGNRIKETIIVTQAGKFTEQARIFAHLYANENTWLNWALDKLGKPLFYELIRFSE